MTDQTLKRTLDTSIKKLAMGVDLCKLIICYEAFFFMEEHSANEIARSLCL